MDNLRDIAGESGASGYAAAGGARLRHGVFYRSSVLTLPEGAVNPLAALNLARVYDLRTPTEIGRQPDVLPPGVAYVAINVLDEDGVTFGGLVSASDTIARMEALERQMVQQPGSRRQLAAVFQGLADGDAAQLFHCTGGKDRTGWVAALLQLHAGVALTDVMRDYLLTNARMQDFVAHHYQAVAATHGQAAAEAVRPALGVQESFLMAGLDQVQQDYGSVAAYLSQGLGLAPAVLARLRDKLLA